MAEGDSRKEMGSDTTEYHSPPESEEWTGDTNVTLQQMPPTGTVEHSGPTENHNVEFVSNVPSFRLGEEHLF
jgi:hypothetical protein